MIKSFRSPTFEERRRAIGSLENPTPGLQRAFSPVGDFAPLPSPGPHDWLANHPEYGTLILRRSCKVLAHEACHMFGIHHCNWYRCLMNGSNHLAESDARPLHLCPVDLRKLHVAVDFNVVDRYGGLQAFWEKVGGVEEAAWLSERLRLISSAD